MPQRKLTLQAPKAEGITNVTLPSHYHIRAIQEGIKQFFLCSTSVICQKDHMETKESTHPRQG